ncbi:MAG: RnfABCDGE type electron transport complex subunit D [Treponema sp.]|nr:RnfABCDGE type electron transport complex subunit D [Treponema sp.]
MTDTNIRRRFLLRPYSYINFSFYSLTVKMLVLLCVQLSMLLIAKSYQAFFVVITSMVASVLADFAWIFCTKNNKNPNMYPFFVAAVQGILCGMLIPQNYPLIAVFIVVFCSMLILKNFFGGFAYAWINPCMFTVIILWIVGADLFPGFLLPLDSLASRNPSLLLIENGIVPVYNFDSAITDFFNDTVFSWFKVSVPEGYISMFWDTNSVIPAFRFNFITLISSIILFSDNFVDMIIPGVFLFVYAVLVRFVSPFFFSGLMFQGDILLAILTSGTLFLSFFLINWNGTIPCTIIGKIVYAFITAVTMFFIAGCGTSSCGAVFTVLVANICSILIQQVEIYFERITLRRNLEVMQKEDSEIKRGLL